MSLRRRNLTARTRMYANDKVEMTRAAQTSQTEADLSQSSTNEVMTALGFELQQILRRERRNKILALNSRERRSRADP